MFNEWLEGIEDDSFEWDGQVFWCREAYKLGLQYGFDSAFDSVLLEAIQKELQELDKGVV